MKRIKAINGYTIYQAATDRDEENYQCRIGNYNVYLSADIRDFGLANSYPEWDDEDSLAVVIVRCNGSHYAVACELADELSDSTIQDMDLVMKIERRLEAGEALETIRESYDTEEQCFIEGVSSEARRDDTALADGPEGDLEDVLDSALAGSTDDLSTENEQHRYLTVISWDDNGHTETCYDVMRPEEIFGRIDMYDCYEEDLSLWLLTPEGPLPCDWHGTWHDFNDPLKMSITLRSTGNVLDLAWGTDH